MGRVFLRVFTHPTSVVKTHAFLVGSESGGLSERIGSFLIHDDTTTFHDLRQLIEVFNDRGMNRRTALFQDVLHTLVNSANPHGYSKAELADYRFAVMSGVGGREVGETNVARDFDRSAVPTLILSQREEETVVAVVGNLNDQDVIIIPISQIRQKDQAVSLLEYKEVVITVAEKKKMEIDYINSIDLSKYSPEKIKAANTRSQKEREEEEEAMARAE